VHIFKFKNEILVIFVYFTHHEIPYTEYIEYIA